MGFKDVQGLSFTYGLGGSAQRGSDASNLLRSIGLTRLITPPIIPATLGYDSITVTSRHKLEVARPSRFPLNRAEFRILRLRLRFGDSALHQRGQGVHT